MGFVVATRNRLPWWARALAAILLAGAGVGLFHDEATWFISRVPGQVAFVEENFNGGFLSRREWATVTGFVPCVDGWCLSPGTQGRLQYRPTLPMHPVRDVQAYLWIYAPPGVTNRILISADAGQTFQVVGTNMHVVNKRIALGSYAKGPHGLLLVFEASSTAATPVLVVDKLILNYLDSPLIPAPAWPWILLGFLTLGAAGVLLCRRPLLAFGSLVIVALGLVVRYRFLVEAFVAPLEPDAQGYRVYARSMSLFTGTGFYSAQFSEREPVFIFVAHLLFRLIGESDFHLRLVSFIVSIVLVWLVTRISIARFGVGIGWIIGLTVAIGRPLAFESARALRLEVETVILLVFLVCAFLWRWPRGLVKASLLGVAAAAMVLTRTNYLPAMAVLCALSHYGDRGTRWDWVKPAAVSIVLMLVLVAPHRYSMYRVHGDAFWDSTAYARWIANFEFAGQPGFPTRAQLEVNSYMGPRITYAEYLFGLHSVGEVVIGTLRGYLKLFVDMTARAAEHAWLPGLGPVLAWILRLLAVGGFVMAALRPECWWLPVAFLTVEFPISFLWDRGVLEARHYLSSFPLVLFAAGVSLSWAVAYGRRMRTPSGGPGGPSC